MSYGEQPDDRLGRLSEDHEALLGPLARSGARQQGSFRLVDTDASSHRTRRRMVLRAVVTLAIGDVTMERSSASNPPSRCLAQ